MHSPLLKIKLLSYCGKATERIYANIIVKKDAIHSRRRSNVFGDA